MAKTALNSLQDQIEEVRREAFAAGYAAAMEAVRAVVARGAPAAATPAAATRGRPRRQARSTGRAAKPATTRTGRGGRRGRPPAAKPAAAAAAKPVARRGRRAAASSSTAAKPQRQRRSSGARPQRGNNARMIEEVLQGIAPRAARPTEIRSALQGKGVSMAFTSIRHALGQLAARQAVEQVGDSNTWRHKGGSGNG